MKRAFVTPPMLPEAALAELKQWLGITTPREDAGLAALLRSALELCEAFTGQLPIEATCEEVLPAAQSWQPLVTRPVQAITAVEGVPAEGSRFALPAHAYAVELDADGTGRIWTGNPGAADRIAVRFTAGLAPGWDALPEALRQGIVRLAAHQHRSRDDDRAGPLPPAAVAALWRPWRRLRLT